MGDKLGLTLVRKGLLTQAQLDQGMSAQLVHGGRLGSRLVELGFLDIETVGMVLGELTRAPVAMEADFDAATEATLKLLTADQAEKHQAFPLAVEGRRLKVALANPLDLQTTDALGFITGMRIVAYVVPELRLFHYLNLRYGIDRPTRALKPAIPLPARRSVSMAAVAPMVVAPVVIPPPAVPPPPAPVRAEPEVAGMFGGLAPGQFLSDDSEEQEAEADLAEAAIVGEELPDIVMGEPVRAPPVLEAARPAVGPPVAPPRLAPTAQPPGMVARQGPVPPPVLGAPGMAGPATGAVAPGGLPPGAGAPARGGPPPGAPGAQPPGMIGRGGPVPPGTRPSATGIPTVQKAPPPGMRPVAPGAPGVAGPRPVGPPGAPMPPGMVRAGPPPGAPGMPPGAAPRPPPVMMAPGGPGPVPPGQRPPNAPG
ncbi:hypothetical protein D7X55_08730, partial [Corallococcus sp. AB049A]